MAKQLAELTYTNYIKQEDGSFVNFNDLSEQDKERVRDKIATKCMASLGYRKVIQKEKIAT